MSAGASRPRDPWYVDDRTLREVVTDEAEVERRLAALPEEPSRTGERVGLLRILGRLDEALELAAADHERLVEGGQSRTSTAAVMRLAQVKHWRGELPGAEALLTSALSHAGAEHDPLLVGSALQLRAACRYDAGDVDGALADATAALKHRRQVGAPQDQVEASERAWSTISAAAIAAAPYGVVPPGSDEQDTHPVSQAGPRPS